MWRGLFIMLKTINLFGEVKDKVNLTIERIRQFEPPEGYYVAFSGGKDSVVVLDLVKKAGVKYDSHYNLTTADPPKLINFIRNKNPEVEISTPEMSMWKLIPKKGMPPTRLIRYCCAILKERGGQNRKVITGVRWAESYNRSKRRMVETCRKNKAKTYLHPIIDWTENDVWEYINKNDIEYCKLYDEGYSRLGCIMCPMGGPKGMKRDAKRYPKFYKLYLKAFERMLAERHRKSLKTSWETPEEVMNWWINNPPSIDENQIALFG